jgi:hypothetical protein
MLGLMPAISDAARWLSPRSRRAVRSALPSSCARSSARRSASAWLLVRLGCLVRRPTPTLLSESPLIRGLPRLRRPRHTRAVGHLRSASRRRGRGRPAKLGCGRRRGRGCPHNLAAAWDRGRGRPGTTWLGWSPSLAWPAQRRCGVGPGRGDLDAAAGEGSSPIVLLARGTPNRAPSRARRSGNGAEIRERS